MGKRNAEQEAVERRAARETSGAAVVAARRRRWDNAMAGLWRWRGGRWELGFGDRVLARMVGTESNRTEPINGSLFSCSAHFQINYFQK